MDLQGSAVVEILGMTARSTFVPEVNGSHEASREAVAGSDVLLQWDPDHYLAGAATERRVIQLGLRDDALGCYARVYEEPRRSPD